MEKVDTPARTGVSLFGKYGNKSKLPITKRHIQCIRNGIGTGPGMLFYIFVFALIEQEADKPANHDIASELRQLADETRGLEHKAKKAVYNVIAEVINGKAVY